MDRTDKDGMRRMLNGKLMVAFLLGFVSILLSYLVFPIETIDQAVPAWQAVVHLTLHEIGFALVVAGVIWALFEYFTQNELMEKISQNVFGAMLKRDLPEALIDEAFDLILHQKLVRKDMSLTYHLSEAFFTNRAGTQQKYVQLEIWVKYKIKNVSRGAAEWTVQISLPNPMINELKPLCRVTKFQIDDVEQDSSSAEQAFRSKAGIDDDKVPEVPYRLTKLRLKPGEERDVYICYFLAKEEEDTEVLQMGLPADGIDITIVDNGPTQRVMRAASIHPSPLTQISGTDLSGPYIFKLRRYFLPHQGVRIWWKNYPSTGPTAKT